MPPTHFPYGISAPYSTTSNLLTTFQGGSPSNIFFVDGDLGSDGNSGKDPQNPVKTIQRAVTLASAGAVIFVKARKIAAGGTDPVSYAETIIIAAAQAGLTIIGVGTDQAQGNIPQIKKGSGSTAMLTVRAPGCTILNMGFNMGGSTGAGILLDDDGSTKTAFGTVIEGCHFKGNANKSNLAGAIAWASTGGAWQCLIKDCTFFDCCTGINILGTSQAVPKDIVIENCRFHGSGKANIDADIDLSGGSGATGVVIRNCDFSTVDVPAKGTGNADRYLDLTGVAEGAVVGCRFACTGKTFGAGDAAIIPTTVRISACYQEVAAGAGATGEIGRT